MINPHCPHLFPLVSDRTALHALCLVPSSARIKHKIAAEAAGHLLGFSWATEVTNTAISPPFFSQATTRTHHCNFSHRLQGDAELTCDLFPSVNAASTKLTNIDRVLPVLQHFGDDEYVNICPVLPVPVLEGKRDRVTTNQQQQQTFVGKRTLGHPKCKLPTLGATPPTAQLILSC